MVFFFFNEDIIAGEQQARKEMLTMHRYSALNVHAWKKNKEKHDAASK